MFKRVVLVLVLAALPRQAAALETKDLLSLVAMPLAVAAVSEITDVPVSDLVDVVTLLNDANVPPAQFIEVVRYAPVALVVDTEPHFDDVIRTQIDQGVSGPALVQVIERHYATVGLPEVHLDAPRVVSVVDDRFIPEVVTTRVAYVKAHPHGGAPGQLKKVVRVQTGAEIVHRNRVRQDDRDRVVVQKVHREKPAKARVVKVEKAEKHVGKQGGGGEKHDGGEKHGGGGGKGHGKGKG